MAKNVFVLTAMVELSEKPRIFYETVNVILVKKRCQLITVLLNENAEYKRDVAGE